MTDPLLPPDLLAEIAADLEAGDAPLEDEELATIAAERTHCEYRLPPLRLTEGDRALMREMATRMPGFADLFDTPAGPRGAK